MNTSSSFPTSLPPAPMRNTCQFQPQRSSPRIAVASSGLGHVARGIEAWAADLGRALAERGETVRLCKGGGDVQSDYEVVIPCWQRHAARTEQLRRWLPPRAVWRFGVGTDYG